MLLSGSSIVPVAGGIIIVLAIGAAVFIRMKKSPSSSDKKAAEDFIKGLSDTFYKTMIDIVNNADPKKFDNIEAFETDILEKIYNDIYEYTKAKLEEAAESDIISAMVLKVIDKDYIIKFVDSVFNNGNIESIIKDVWAKNFEEKVSEMEEVQDIAIGHDVDGNEIIYSGSDYNENFDEKNDLPLAEDEDIDQEALRKVIPPSDDEEPVYNEDTSEDESLFFFDKNGRKRDKKTGRYTK